MKILAIESSCDETAAAVVENGRTVLSDVVLSQIDIHTVYGGVVPEIASRKHIEAVSGLTRLALEQSGLTMNDIDAVAVTYAPGLIGALLVGVNFAKGLALAAGKPLIPVHHHRSHIAANYLFYPDLEPPFLAVVISGGHTLIVDVKSFTEMHIIGSTRDDAAGEAFDKVARVLGLGYPGGPKIDAVAKNGDPNAYHLPHPQVEGSPYDFSFSGLKTAVINLNHQAKQKNTNLNIADLAASFSEAVAEMLVQRTEAAAMQYQYRKIVVAGGVAANSTVRSKFNQMCERHDWEIFFPPLKYCGDGAAMVGAQAFYESQEGSFADLDLNAYATLPIDSNYNNRQK